MTDTQKRDHSVTPEELAEEVWEDESPATVEPREVPRDVPRDVWHPDVNELLEHSTSFEE